MNLASNRQDRRQKKQCSGQQNHLNLPILLRAAALRWSPSCSLPLGHAACCCQSHHRRETHPIPDHHILGCQTAWPVHHCDLVCLLNQPYGRHVLTIRCCEPIAPTHSNPIVDNLYGLCVCWTLQKAQIFV